MVGGVSPVVGGVSPVHCVGRRVGSLLLLQDLFSRTVVLCVKMLTIKSHS